MFSIKTIKSDFPKSLGKRFKIIVNAGGGLYGYIISTFMSYLNFDLYSKIDAVAGTSIGGILAMAYSLDIPYTKINEIFKSFGPKIFSNKNLLGLLRN